MLLIGDSNLRRVNEKAFYVKTDCATGAKIGHVANNLEYVDRKEHDLIVCHMGQNNVLHNEKINMDEWQKQIQYEVNNLKNKLTNLKKSVIVGVPPAPWCKKN